MVENKRIQESKRDEWHCYGDKHTGNAVKTFPWTNRASKRKRWKWHLSKRLETLPCSCSLSRLLTVVELLQIYKTYQNVQLFAVTINSSNDVGTLAHFQMLTNWSAIYFLVSPVKIFKNCWTQIDIAAVNDHAKNQVNNQSSNPRIMKVIINV